MATQRGIVLESAKRYSIVLTPDGVFQRLRAGCLPVGKEVTFDERELAKPNPSWWKLATAACLLLVLSACLWFPTHPAVAYWVSLDANSSLELGVDQHDRVITVQPVNEAGRKLAEGEQLRGKPVDQVVQRLVERSSVMGYYSTEEDTVVIGITAADTSNEGENAGRVAELRSKLAKKTQTPNVLVSTVSPAARQEARANGLSVGQYLTWQALKNNGILVEPQEIKNKGLGQVARENKRNLWSLLTEDQKPKNTEPKSEVASDKRGSNVSRSDSNRKLESPKIFKAVKATAKAGEKIRERTHITPAKPTDSKEKPVRSSVFRKDKDRKDDKHKKAGIPKKIVILGV